MVHSKEVDILVQQRPQMTFGGKKNEITLFILESVKVDNKQQKRQRLLLQRRCPRIDVRTRSSARVIHHCHSPPTLRHARQPPIHLSAK